MIDESNDRLSQCVKHARNTKNFSLFRCLRNIKNVNRNVKSETHIYFDWSPFCLYFEKTYKDGKKSNSGIIYHGNHDGFGIGGSDTFSVCLTPTEK